MSPIRKKKTKLGELLLQADFITPEQLRKALAYQLQEGNKDKPLGQIVFELGYIDKEKLYFALAIQTGYAYIQIKNYKLDPGLVKSIPEEVVRTHLVFPIDRIRDIVTVAMVNPLDKDAAAQIQHFTHCDVKAFLTTRAEMHELIAMYYGNKPE
jgi:type IV pilus assembly protein PilB